MTNRTRKGFSKAMVCLPSVTVDSYNLEIRDAEGFVGDRATNRAFFDIIADIRARLRDTGTDPLGRKKTAKLSRKTIERILLHGDPHAAGLLMSAVEEFSQTLAAVIRRFMREKEWKGTQRIVVGGGMRGSRAGELAIGRTTVLLRLAGIELELVPVRNDPNHAGLIGVAHLVPCALLEGHDAMLAVDIGGSSIRAGLLKLPKRPARSLKSVRIVKMHQWKYSEEDRKISRNEAVQGIARMLHRLMRKAEAQDMRLAPIVGIGCPGRIDAEGNILAGGQNLPGNWEADHFNLPDALARRLRKITERDFTIAIHNDAVVQGLSEIPNVSDVERWGAITIGTGLGNARFTNLKPQHG